MTDARDVIATALFLHYGHLPKYTTIFELYPEADVILGAFEAAGLSITATPDTWEYNVRMDGGDLLWKRKGRPDRDEVAAHCLPGTADQLVRRHPATPWEDDRV